MLQGKTIIVTGAASGIGAVTAALVSSHGAEVISVDIKDINVPEAPVGRFMQADLADRSTGRRLIAWWRRCRRTCMALPTSPGSFR